VNKEEEEGEKRRMRKREKKKKEKTAEPTERETAGIKKRISQAGET
jgi:hypothetical protein